MRKPKTIVIFNNHYEIKSGQDGYGLDAILMYYRQENDGSGTMNCFIIELPTSCQLLWSRKCCMIYSSISRIGKGYEVLNASGGKIGITYE